MKHSQEERKKIANDIVNILGSEWVTYAYIKGKMKDKVSVGLISSVIWNNINNIQDKIVGETEVYGDQEQSDRNPSLQCCVCGRWKRLHGRDKNGMAIQRFHACCEKDGVIYNHEPKDVCDDCCEKKCPYAIKN